MNVIRHGEFAIPADHASLPGHFPGRPLVPGVVLLDAVLASLGEDAVLLAIRSAKFLAPVLPGEHIRVRLEISDGEGPQRVAFHGTRGDTRVFEGVLLLAERAS